MEDGRAIGYDMRTPAVQRDDDAREKEKQEERRRERHLFATATAKPVRSLRRTGRKGGGRRRPKSAGVRRKHGGRFGGSGRTGMAGRNGRPETGEREEEGGEASEGPRWGKSGWGLGVPYFGDDLDFNDQPVAGGGAKMETGDGAGRGAEVEAGARAAGEMARYQQSSASERYAKAASRLGMNPSQPGGQVAPSGSGREQGKGRPGTAPAGGRDGRGRRPQPAHHPGRTMKVRGGAGLSVQVPDDAPLQFRGNGRGSGKKGAGAAGADLSSAGESCSPWGGEG